MEFAGENEEGPEDRGLCDGGVAGKKVVIIGVGVGGEVSLSGRGFKEIELREQ